MHRSLSIPSNPTHSSEPETKSDEHTEKMKREIKGDPNGRSAHLVRIMLSNSASKSWLKALKRSNSSLSYRKEASCYVWTGDID
ncbi:hypothetical protein FRC19_001651 [Serendipita sp. 401]|nr:hypothetical protein FRC19_001651 [Serendipita sp. 401]KAG9054992.1 hypothetical protein FS842_003443 [Serendipita sp. 407]